MDIYIENANTIPKWIKDIFASEFNLVNEKAIHERHNFKQSVIYVYMVGSSWS